MMNITTLIVLVSFAVPQFASAHSDHLWTSDHRAYKSVKLLKNLKAADKPDVAHLEKTAEMLKAYLTEISVKIKERKSPEGREAVRQYLNQEYMKLGFKTSEQKYGSFRSGANFIADKVGRDPSKVLIVTSHIDSVGNAGANDDGMGTAAALVIAKALSETTHEYSVRMVGFDQEEIGLVGSAQYVSALKDKSQIIGNIQMEMMGFNGKKDGKFHVIDCDRAESTFLTTEILKAIAELSLPIQINKACTDRSDHASFWKAKIPAVVISENFFGDDSDPCYHKACDVLDKRLDFGYAAKITEALALAVKKIVIVK